MAHAGVVVQPSRLRLQIWRKLHRLGVVYLQNAGAREQAQEKLKRERVAYLRARRLAYFGSSRNASVDERLDGLKQALDQLYRSDS